jgi:outer membrane receptor protein involved in Fe transport
MKRVNVFLLLFFLVSVNVLMAQRGPAAGGELSGSVTGLIVDKQTGQPLEYANVTIHRIKEKDTVLVNGSITDAKGNFTINDLSVGKYIVKVGYVGYNTLVLPEFSIAPKIRKLNLGTINIDPSAENLKEATVTFAKKTEEFKLDRKVVNVEGNLASVGGTAVDVLQNIPSVTVDQDGGVSLRGNDNITILIDGRPSSITGANLDQIPSSSIETIELITNPSAKYNPEGTAGIINIKLKKKVATGLNGMVQLNTATANANNGSKTYNGSLNLNYSVGKFNFFGSYDPRYDNRVGYGNMKRIAYGTMDTTLHEKNTTLLKENFDQSRERVSNNFRLGTDIYFNKQNQLTLSWFSANNNRIRTRSGLAIDSSFLNQKIDKAYSISNPDHENSVSNDFNLNYRKTFDRKDEELTVDLIQNFDHETSYANNEQINFNPLTLIDTLSLNKYRTNTNEKDRTTTLQANYVYPFGNEGKIETGWQSIVKQMDNDYQYDSLSAGTYIKDMNKSNHFVYDQQVHAFYTTVGTMFNNFSFLAGIRLEETFTRSEVKLDTVAYKRNYLDYFPSLHLSQKFGNGNQMQISYSRRINRPGGWALNPFIDRTDPQNYRQGNPYLKPEYVNSFETGYSKDWKTTTLNASVFYRQTTDVISRINRLNPDTKIATMTFENLGKGTSYGVEIIGEQSITPWWHINVNWSYFYNEIKGKASDSDSSTYTNHNYTWTARAMSNMMLPGRFNIQATGNYRGEMVTPQGRMEPMYFMDIAAKKEFLKGKLSLTARVSDVFNTQKFRMKISDVNYYSENMGKFSSRMFYVGLIYKINQGVKQKQKKTIDDNNGGGENQGVDF